LHGIHIINKPNCLPSKTGRCVMKTSIKKYFSLLFLIMLGITGCTTTKRENTKIATHDILVNTDLPSDKEKAVEAVKKESQQLPHITDIQAGRYSSIKSKPTQSQRELLQVVITVSIPDEITSIGQTIEYLLKRSGYQLVQPQAKQIELTRFFLKRLPDVHRHIGPMSLEDALIILTAPAFKLNQDPVSRLISYELDTCFAGEIV